MQAANRVAINTAVQYIQLVLNVVIGLFSVRIILDSLGTIDYGVYNLLGGVIGLLAFINSSLSQTSVRYISVSLGKKDIEDLRRTFNACFSLHLSMAFVMAIILEVIGLFLFDGFLDIPEDRVFAAKLVYHCMVFTLFLQITVSPFSAMLVAHEKFVYTSSIGILNALCKLGIALMISYTTKDKLVLYGALMALLVVIDVSLYVGYIFIKYGKEVSFKHVELSRIKGVMGFAGWTLFDVLGSVFNRQGYAVLLNKYFGPATNTVYALAGQVEGHLYTMSSSVINTMKPQIMKSQGSGDTQRALRLSLTSGKFGCSMMSLLAIPIIILMPEVLDIWLKEVPEGTVLFSRLMVIACMFNQVTMGLVAANQAIGKIKWFSIIVSCTRMAALPISVLFCIFGAPSYIPMIVFAVCETLASFSRVLVMSKLSSLRIYDFMKSVMLQILPPMILSAIAGVVLHTLVHGLLGMAIVTVCSALVYALVFYLIGMTSVEKSLLINIVKQYVPKHNK